MVYLDDLANLKWDNLDSELKTRAPVLHAFLHKCVDVKRRPRPFKTSYRARNAVVMGVCSSIILRHKNQHLNLMQHIVSIILHHGHAGKLVHDVN